MATTRPEGWGTAAEGVLWWDLCTDGITEFVDSVELLVEDQDEAAADQLEEAVRYIMDDLPTVVLLAVLNEQDVSA